MGNLGYDTPRVQVEAKAREVLQQVGAEEPCELHAGWAYGSSVEMVFSSPEVGQKICKQILEAKISGHVRGKNVWMATSKTRDERAPHKQFMKVESIIRGYLSKDGHESMLTVCKRSKRFYLSERMILRIDDKALIWTNPDDDNLKPLRDEMTSGLDA